MNKILLPVILSTLIFTSCEVSIGESKEENQEEIQVKNGFTYGQKVLTINGLEDLEGNELIAGENFMIQFFDVNNATIKDGYQHVGISFKATDDQGNVLEEVADLFSNIEQQDTDLDYFKAYYGVPRSLIGQELSIEYRLFDKYGTVSYDFKEKYKVVDKEGPVTKGINIETNIEGLNITGQLIYNNIQFASAPAEIAAGEDLYLYLNGVNGFTLENNELKSHYVLTLTDQDGKDLYQVENTLNGSVEGYTYYPLYFKEKFNKVEPGTYYWKAYLKDDLSDKFVEAIAKIKIK
jgi:hypothetical protein